MVLTDSLAVKLEQQLPGFKACFGGEELKRATSVLAGGIDMPPLTGTKDKESLGGSALPVRPILAGNTSLLAVLAQSSHPDASEGDLVLRELALAANQYQRTEASTRSNDQDYETLYNHGLVLQEMAAMLHTSPADQVKLLHQACQLYGSASAARPSSHNVMYNWGVALSDMARLLRDSNPAEALGYLQQASHKYADSLDLHPGNPQALNNWGLVLQEMSGLAQSASERDQLVSYALEKFRHAIRLRPDFDRGCYNLGTVLYTYACAVQAELATELKAGRLTSSDAETTRERHQREYRARCLFTSAAQYICLAATLQPGRDIYRRSLAVVRPMLPLPFLRAGYLTAPLAHTLGSPAEAWRRMWFVLDPTSLRSASELESTLTSAASGNLSSSLPTLKIGHAVGEMPLVVPLDAILSVRRVNDPSLPEGEALWLQLSRPLECTSSSGGNSSNSGSQQLSRSSRDRDLGTTSERAGPLPEAAGHELDPGPSGVPMDGFHFSLGNSWDGVGGQELSCAPPRLCIWLVADDADSADAWADALLLAQHVVNSRSPRALEEALMPQPVGYGIDNGSAGGGGVRLGSESGA